MKIQKLDEYSNIYFRYNKNHIIHKTLQIKIYDCPDFIMENAQIEIFEEIALGMIRPRDMILRITNEKYTIITRVPNIVNIDEQEIIHSPDLIIENKTKTNVRYKYDKIIPAQISVPKKSIIICSIDWDEEGGIIPETLVILEHDAIAYAWQFYPDGSHGLTNDSLIYLFEEDECIMISDEPIELRTADDCHEGGVDFKKFQETLKKYQANSAIIHV